MALKKLGDKGPGIQDNELSRAYEIAMTQPESSFTIIPVRIEDCDRGGCDVRLTSFQQYDVFEGFENGLDKLSLDLGGISFADVNLKDTRSENDKLANSLIGRAASLYLTGAEREALEMYDHAIALDPNNDFAWFSKGAILLELKQFEEALEAFDRAIEINPYSADAWANKGFTLNKIPRLEDELSAYKKSLEIQPQNRNVLLYMGNVLIKLGRYDEAIEAFDKLLEISPGDTVAIAMKGEALKYKGLGGNRQSILLDSLLRSARESVNADAGTIYIRDRDWLTFTFFENITIQKREMARTGKEPIFSMFHVPVDERSIVGYVATHGHSLNIEDVYKLDTNVPYKFSRGFDEYAEYRTKSIITVPIQNDVGQNLGILQLINAKDESGRLIKFAKADEKILRHFALIAAEALQL